MKNRIIVTTAITACLALCAAVWPQAKTIKETPLPSEMAAVYAPKATVEELKAEGETVSPTEKEKAEILPQEQAQEAAPEPEPVPAKHPQRQKLSPHRSHHLSRKCLIVSLWSKLQNRP